jgi:hypothetical protein
MKDSDEGLPRLQCISVHVDFRHVQVRSASLLRGGIC